MPRTSVDDALTVFKLLQLPFMIKQNFPAMYFQIFKQSFLNS